MKRIPLGSNVRLNFDFVYEGEPIAPTLPKIKIYDPLSALIHTADLSPGSELGSYTYLFPIGVTASLGVHSAFGYGSYVSEDVWAVSEEIFEVIQVGSKVPLITLEDLKDYVGDMPDLPSDPQLRELIYVATDVVQGYCGRSFVPKAVSEFHTIRDTDRLFLTRHPVLSLTSIKDLENADVSYKAIVQNIGLIIFEAFVQELPVTVTFVEGDNTIPYEVALACKKVCSYLIQRRNREGVSSERLLSYNYTINSDWFRQEIAPLLSSLRLVRMS